jgi:hypothetical protein
MVMTTLKKAQFQFEAAQDSWGPFMDVQYNPENLSVSQSASWNKQSASGGSAVSPIQFQSTNPRTISMDLIFDMTASSVDGSDVYSLFVVRFQNAMIPTIKCTQPAPKQTATKNGNKADSTTPNTPALRPPRLKFKWGNVEMMAVIKSLKSDFTMFSPEGKAVRAKVSITLEEYLSELEAYVPAGDMGGYNIKQVKLVQVQQGQTLSSLAMMAGMTTGALAELNGIDNPLAISAGTMLKLPLS